MIKPEFWSSQTLSKVSLEARLLFVGLWNFCDDFGVCLNSDRKILGEIFPLDEHISERILKKWKQELIREGLVIPVEVSGSNYLIIRTWREHQRVPNPSERRWLDSETIEKLITDYVVSNETLHTDSLLKGKVKEKDKEKEERRGDWHEQALLSERSQKLTNLPNFLSSWREWLAYRKELNKPLRTATVKKQLEFLSKQSDPIAVINQSIQNGWQGLFEEKNGNNQSGYKGDFSHRDGFPKSRQGTKDYSELITAVVRTCPYCHQLVGTELNSHIESEHPEKIAKQTK